MNVLIVSPLFPPDASLSARYTKELGVRLSQSNQVSILHFGVLPESIKNVSFTSISKKSSLWLRAIKMTYVMYRASKDADVILLQNGPSVELPTLLISYLRKKKIICFYSDAKSKQRVTTSRWQRKVHVMLSKRCSECIAISNIADYVSPMIHPLKEAPESELRAFEESWSQHLDVINHAF